MSNNKVHIFKTIEMSHTNAEYILHYSHDNILLKILFDYKTTIYF